MQGLSLAEIRALVDAGQRIPDPRGTCVVCLRRVRLRQDGTIGHHQHWLYKCGGVGHAPTYEQMA